MGLTVAYISDNKPDPHTLAVRDLAERLRVKWEARDHEEARKMFGLQDADIAVRKPIA